jgi:hypothetical protein
VNSECTLYRAASTVQRSLSASPPPASLVPALDDVCSRPASRTPRHTRGIHSGLSSMDSTAMGEGYVLSQRSEPLICMLEPGYFHAKTGLLSAYRVFPLDLVCTTSGLKIWGSLLAAGRKNRRKSGVERIRIRRRGPNRGSVLLAKGARRGSPGVSQATAALPSEYELYTIYTE